MQRTMRQVPARHALSPFAPAHRTPHAPQFLGSLASTASQALAGLPSQSAVPLEQFCNRGALSGATAPGCALVVVALSAEALAGVRAAQLPNPKRRPSASNDARPVTRTGVFSRVRLVRLLTAVGPRMTMVLTHARLCSRRPGSTQTWRGHSRRSR